KDNPALPGVQTKIKVLASVVALSFLLKLLLQTLSAFPAIAELAYVYNYYVIAYLHLVLIGIITLSMLIWYIEQGMLSVSLIWILLLLTGFILSELVMVLVPSIQLLARYSAPILFSVSILMFVGFAAFLISFIRKG